MYYFHCSLTCDHIYHAVKTSTTVKKSDEWHEIILHLFQYTKMWDCESGYNVLYKMSPWLILIKIFQKCVWLDKICKYMTCYLLVVYIAFTNYNYYIIYAVQKGDFQTHDVSGAFLFFLHRNMQLGFSESLIIFSPSPKIDWGLPRMWICQCDQNERDRPRCEAVTLKVLCKTCYLSPAFPLTGCIELLNMV